MALRTGSGRKLKNSSYLFFRCSIKVTSTSEAKAGVPVAWSRATMAPRTSGSEKRSAMRSSFESTSEVKTTMRISVAVSPSVAAVAVVVSSVVDAAKFLDLAIAIGFAPAGFAEDEETLSLFVKDIFIEDVVGSANDFEVLFRFATAAFKVASFFAFTFLMYSFK